MFSWCVIFSCCNVVLKPTQFKKTKGIAWAVQTFSIENRTLHKAFQVSGRNMWLLYSSLTTCIKRALIPVSHYHGVQLPAALTGTKHLWRMVTQRGSAIKKPFIWRWGIQSLSRKGWYCLLPNWGCKQPTDNPGLKTISKPASTKETISSILNTKDNNINNKSITISSQNNLAKNQGWYFEAHHYNWCRPKQATDKHLHKRKPE